MNTGEAIWFYITGLLILGLALGVVNGSATYGWTVIGSGVMGISVIMVILNFILSITNKKRR